MATVALKHGRFWAKYWQDKTDQIFINEMRRTIVGNYESVKFSNS